MSLPDPRVTEALRFCFESRGARVESMSTVEGIAAILDQSDGPAPQLVIAGAESADRAIELLSGLHRAMRQQRKRVPVLYLGNAVSRARARAAGAAELLPRPAYLRDVLTMAQLLCSPKRRGTSTVHGRLADYEGVFYLIRTVTAVGCCSVLSMVRGLRRGELRFYNGEVTSAQLGMLHGLAALHQLLLWTQADFELRHEDVVRRQQIPLETAELMADAQRFLAEIRAVATALDLSGVYIPVAARVKAEPLPNAVLTVLKLLDGYRTIADVIEDSPFRVFDTLRIANRLATVGLMERFQLADSDGGDSSLMLDEWMTGPTSSGIPSLIDEDDELDAGQLLADGSDNSDADMSAWSKILPTSLSPERSVSQVVPASVAAGEIMVSSAQPATALAPGSGPDPQSSSQERSANTDDEETEPDLEVIEDAEADANVVTAEADNDAEADDDTETGEVDASFRDGSQVGMAPSVAAVAELEPDSESPSFWQRLFGRGKRTGPA
ncbi:MAG: DUF4388 domain-containing protein [Proteobacteria bacterium]|nr:DUF4388 domain-containing protein [Pseudomonadota bacterium]